LRASTLANADQRQALLPTLMSYQVPRWPEHLLTRNDAEELETLVRGRSSSKWQATEDFSESIKYERQAIQIPSAAHSALEYQRWAVRSQFRGEGSRFMKLMDRRIDIPVLHLRGSADPYVLADPVVRSRPYAPHGRFAEIPGIGHYAHEESPQAVNNALQRFLDSV
jgi:pimeloyl-ACP methyl ester carboxylesterase